MGCEISPELAQGALETLQSMQDPNGGFGGGNRQVPHLADTYAAVMALALLESEDALGIVDREKMLGWLIRMKQSDGSFCMHEDGEVDVRGTYCALVIASLLNIMTPEVTEGCAEFIAKCQTWEGGISLYPGVEAHGGYTLCGLAALEILGRSDILDLKRLSRWMILRQLPFEGGFNGRANKLVDGCYSYWQGGSFVLLQKALKRSQAQDYLFDREALQRYVLACCQARDRRGGLRDKPGKSSDLYHTMYVLCGLSLAQHYVGVEPEKIVSSTESVYSVPVRMMQWGAILKGLNVLGHRSNLVKPIHPVYAIPFSPLAKAVKYFYSLPPLAETLH
ncbi:CAAX farnesyltransferase (FTase) subunit beta [Linderina macrospora]|uniref:CAAX farnesyltransferase (FTase) subunit beta n=1 Tax=Linderina macrospora TaxID=4868 RepID=A0ACC1J8D5_9FUNG|nr:CAAX farnesyltransferase (FTase) subunit beta [Linderina macrospora]